MVTVKGISLCIAAILGIIGLGYIASKADESTPAYKRCVEYKTERRMIAVPNHVLPCPRVGIINTCGGMSIGGLTYTETTEQVCARYEMIPNPRYKGSNK